MWYGNADEVMLQDFQVTDRWVRELRLGGQGRTVIALMLTLPKLQGAALFQGWQLDIRAPWLHASN